MDELKHRLSHMSSDALFQAAHEKPHHQAMLDNQTLARRIHEAIEGSQYSQAAIAAAFGITEQAVSGWIRTGKFDKRKAPRLAELTGRPVEFFLQESYPAAQPHGSSQLARPDPATLRDAMRLLLFVSKMQATPIDFSEDADALLAAYDLVSMKPSDFELEDASKRMVEFLQSRRNKERSDGGGATGSGGRASRNG